MQKVLARIFAKSMIAQAERQLLEDKCTAMATNADHLQQMRVAAGLVNLAPKEPK